MRWLIIQFCGYILILSQLACSGATGERSGKDLGKKVSVYIDSVRIEHRRGIIQIPVRGLLEPWVQIDMTLPDSAQIIALLTEPEHAVKKGDLLASLWPLHRGAENTPIDLVAPISGIINKINYKINQIVPAGMPVLSLEDRSYLQLIVSVETWVLDYIREGDPVKIYLPQKTALGVVKKVDIAPAQCVISLDNRRGNITKEQFVHADILTRQLDGDFVRSSYFGEKQALKVRLKDGIELNIYTIGVLDSMTMIYPPLPDENYIQIFKKNLAL